MAPPAGRDGSLGRGARTRILEAANSLFARQGFNATSINDLRAAARVSKRTLYQQFGSKEDLVLAHLAESEATSATEAVLAREQLTPRSRLLELFTALAVPGPVGRDPFIAAAVEFPDPGHPVHRAATAYGHRFVGRLSDLARAAGARDPEQVGRRLALLYEGAACRIAVDDAAVVVADAHAVAASLLREAID